MKFKILKGIFTYLIWTLTALLLGVGYLWIFLKPYETSSDGIGYPLYLFYHWGVVVVGLTIGFIVAFLFIILDLYYLRNHLKNNPTSTLIRFGILICILLLIACMYYVLEKVLDII